MLRVGGQNHNWPTNGQINDTTPDVRGGPQHFRAGDKISGEGTKSEFIHKWADLLQNT